MQSIGERLEEARKRKGVSLREAAEATKIRGDYLQKFENNQYDIKLPEIYVRGFLRTYANYLKLPGDKLVADYNGLGLGEAKPRQLNRELYGRMEIGVETRKPGEDEPKPKNAGAAAVLPDEPKDPKKNPATFVPQGGTQIDTGIILRLGGIAVGAILVVLLVAWALFGRSSSTPASRPSTQAAVSAPAVNEPSITLVAKGNVSVTVTLTSNGTVLYQGNLRAGDSQPVAWRGALRVSADPFQNLEFEIAGKRYPMPNQRTADIRAPQ